MEASTQEEPILSSSQEESLLLSNLPPSCLGVFLDSGSADGNVATAGDEEVKYDRDLLAVEKQSLETGTLTPIVKHELKLLIQSRRASKGQAELRVDFANTPAEYQLTEAEEERRSRRRDQNRRAAQRFREKKKVSQNSLLEEMQILESQNEGLHEKISKLTRLKAKLETMFSRHKMSCPYLLAPVHTTSTTSTSFQLPTSTFTSQNLTSHPDITTSQDVFVSNSPNSALTSPSDMTTSQAFASNSPNSTLASPSDMMTSHTLAPNSAMTSHSSVLAQSSSSEVSLLPTDYYLEKYMDAPCTSYLDTSLSSSLTSYLDASHPSSTSSYLGASLPEASSSCLDTSLSSYTTSNLDASVSASPTFHLDTSLSSCTSHRGTTGSVNPFPSSSNTYLSASRSTSSTSCFDAPASFSSVECQEYPGSVASTSCLDASASTPYTPCLDTSVSFSSTFQGDAFATPYTASRRGTSAISHGPTVDASSSFSSTSHLDASVSISSTPCLNASASFSSASLTDASVSTFSESRLDSPSSFQVPCMGTSSPSPALVSTSSSPCLDTSATLSSVPHTDTPVSTSTASLQDDTPSSSLSGISLVYLFHQLDAYAACIPPPSALDTVMQPSSSDLKPTFGEISNLSSRASQTTKDSLATPPALPYCGSGSSSFLQLELPTCRPTSVMETSVSPSSSPSPPYVDPRLLPTVLHDDAFFTQQ